ncbi:MAG TPA: ergothioneine biosynthesis protein EgtC [Gammaproteobacteria bacterium]|nr:ergothioneine biosynthesis protein EgtC [Gammaproteobacteria bacterium]
MCRLAAYLGPTLALQRFLVDPPHSLIKQAWAPREMQEAVLNADGFGIGWYNDSRPHTYLNIQPIWSDNNLDGLCASLHSDLWLANVRSATPGQMTGLNNTQPFVSGNLMYIHNGFIEDFSPQLRSRFHQRLHPDIQAGIRGNTDSEYLFALIRQHSESEPEDLAAALRNAIDELTIILSGKGVLLNIILSDGKKIYALRHAINKSCPSLYYAMELADYPDAALIASERLNDDNNWQAVPEHSLLRLERNKKVHVDSL